MRSPRDLEKTEYDDFFKSTFKEFMEPAAYSHFKTEVRKGAASWSSWTPSFMS
jgi:HSP90 family molecular chaperone